MATNITVDTLLDRVQDLAPLLRAHSAEAEANRYLSRPVVDAMLEAGLYSMARPQAFGGLELDPLTMFRVLEAVARHDNAASWNMGMSVGGHLFMAWLPDEGAAEILHSHPPTILAGSFTPGRQARPVDGGYRLSGQWPFASGCHEAHWFICLPEILEGDQPRRNDQGNPVQRFMFLPAHQVSILDTWHTLGMRGTGSNDIVVSDAFVPDQHTALLAPLEQPGTAYQGPLYRLSLWVAVAFLACSALGIARAALDALLALAQTKTPSYMSAGLSQRQVVQRQIAKAEATLSAGRAYLYATFQESWAAAVQGAPIPLEQKLKMQLAATHSIVCAVKTVDLVHTVAGTSAIRNEYPFQKYFRDVHSIQQHAYASASRYESVGARMLGAESDWGFFDF
jgi:alkylation response protein AidB-like acyl-CoA dehydrogenase